MNSCAEPAEATPREPDQVHQASAHLQTEIAEARQRIQELEQELAAQTMQQNRLRFALEGSHDGVWDWDIPKQKVSFSDQWKCCSKVWLSIRPNWQL